MRTSVGLDRFLDLWHGAKPITINLVRGFVTIGGVRRPAQGFEGARGLGSGNATLIGNAAPNHLEGDLGDDHIEGRGGDDLLVGFLGTDFLDGGDGLDECRDGETVLNCES